MQNRDGPQTVPGVHRCAQHTGFQNPSSSLPASLPRFTPNHNPELTAPSDIAIKGVNENKDEIFLNSVQCQKKLKNLNVQIQP